MFKIFPYKAGSASAKSIAKALSVKRLKEQSSFTPPSSAVVLNWGCSTLPHTHCLVVNKPEAVALAANKLLTFQALNRAGIPIPEFTTAQHTAQAWSNSGSRVFARKKLTGHNGEGIVIVEVGQAVPHAPLYTKYKRKEHEYRVHVFGGKVIDVTEKRRRNDAGSGFIRNLDNGWVYCRSDVRPHANVLSYAIKAVQALGLDFGGVDVIEKDGNVFIIEVNTAPGVVNTTLSAYVNAIKEQYGWALMKRRSRNVSNRRSRHFR